MTRIMEDAQKIKPYIAHLNAQIKKLEGELTKLTSQPLDEQLLLLKDDKEKLNLSNKYAYVLASLLFSYMKVLGVKDITPVMSELERVKKYMNEAKALDQKDVKADKLKAEEQERAKKIIRNALDGRQTGPAISRVNFEGKHTRFEDDDKSSEDDNVLADNNKRALAEQATHRKKLNTSKGKISKKRKDTK